MSGMNGSNDFEPQTKAPPAGENPNRQLTTPKGRELETSVKPKPVTRIVSAPPPPRRGAIARDRPPPWRR